MPNFSDCDLHIPHKDWSGDARERENYSAIERWVQTFRRNCLGGGGCTCYAEIFRSDSTSVVTSTNTLLTANSLYLCGTRVPTARRLLISGDAQFQANGNGGRSAGVVVGGITDPLNHQCHGLAAVDMPVGQDQILPFGASYSQAVFPPQVLVWQNSGGNLSVVVCVVYIGLCGCTC